MSTMANTTSNSTSAYTLEDIASYHIALWTAVLLVSALLLTLCGLLSMENDAKDPQLYFALMDAGGSGSASAGR